MLFGLFGSGNDNGITFHGGFRGSQKDFLVEANDAYLLTLKQLDMRHCAKYLSRDAYMKVYNSLHYERPWVGISNKFKKVTWVMNESFDDGSFVAEKLTVFDKVNVSRQLQLKVCDDYKELWAVSKQKGKYLVERILVYE